MAKKNGIAGSASKAGAATKKPTTTAVKTTKVEPVKKTGLTIAQKQAIADKNAAKAAAAQVATGENNPRLTAARHADLKKASNAQIVMNRAAKEAASEAEQSTFSNNQYNRNKGIINK